MIWNKEKKYLENFEQNIYECVGKKSHEKENSKLDWSHFQNELSPEVIVKRYIGGYDKETRRCDIGRFDGKEELWTIEDGDKG